MRLFAGLTMKREVLLLFKRYYQSFLMHIITKEEHMNSKRMIQSLLPQDPHFKGRRFVTFHNQRDFIFFGHHRYIFDVKEKKEDLKDKNAIKVSKDKTKPKVLARLQESGQLSF